VNTLASIRNHGRRGYLSLQILLGGSAVALAGLLVADGGSAMPSSALAFCLAANVLAILILGYMRRTIIAELDRASADAEERQHRAITDTLTGAMMRGHFLDELKRGVGRPLEPRQATLVLVDIDHFKQFNDSFGHPLGDAVLVHVVKAMKRIFPDGAVGRLGGDEFGIILQDCDIQTTLARADLLLETLRGGVRHENHTIALSASIGAALAPLHATQPKELMLLADVALYESKSAGRGRMTLFDKGMLSDKRHRRFIERELRAAIYMNELELHYQPVVNSDGSVFGVEGLVRWRHSVRGLIPPDDFIPIAESSVLIDTLGEWVFRRACADLPAFPGCRISINVSGEQLKRDEFISMLTRVLDETGSSADRFVLEITETVVTTATADVLRRLAAARSMGFRVALDDFGTGFCGFNYLKTLPVDAIKVDKSYIQSLSEDEVARVLVAALAQIAQIRDLSIVAEGVETELDFTLARAAGCNRFQGYHFARPAPKEALAHFFKRDRDRLLALAS
jgi:diguanylate cyclase (GGDEF)-like protein